MMEKQFLRKVTSRLCRNPGAKNFAEITLAHTVSEINEFLCFTQKFKMAARNGGNFFF